MRGEVKRPLVSPDRNETELKPNRNRLETGSCVESIQFWFFEHAQLLEPCAKPNKAVKSKLAGFQP